MLRALGIVEGEDIANASEYAVFRLQFERAGRVLHVAQLPTLVYTVPLRIRLPEQALNRQVGELVVKVQVSDAIGEVQNDYVVAAPGEERLLLVVGLDKLNGIKLKLFIFIMQMIRLHFRLEDLAEGFQARLLLQKLLRGQETRSLPSTYLVDLHVGSTCREPGAVARLVD